MIKNKQLKRFGTTIKKIKKENPKLIIRVHLKYTHYTEVVKYAPKKRMQLIESKRNKMYNELCKKLDAVGKPLDGNSPRRGLTYEISFSELDKLNLSRNDTVSYCSIQEIEGKKVKKPNRSFISVKVRIGIRVEGFNKGRQSYEDRIVLVKAKSTKDAKLKVKKGVKKESVPYLNSNGRLVNWKFEKILDAYETGIVSLKEYNEKYGVEVFSRIRHRKITPLTIMKKQWKGSM